MFIFKSCETIKYKYKKVVSTQNEKPGTNQCLRLQLYNSERLPTK